MPDKPITKPGSENGTVVSRQTFLRILDKHGPWAFWSLILGAVIFFFLLKPAAAERKMLLEAVTDNMNRNATAMEKMTGAVEQLNKTLGALEESQLAMQERLRKFTIDAEDVHHKQIESLSAIQKLLSTK